MSIATTIRKGHSMKYALFAAILLAVAALGISVPAYAGNCDHSWQTAADGSSCGGRAADVRPGGRGP